MDSGRFGTQGIRYSLSGAGSELFKVSDTGAITVAECSYIEHHRRKRQTISDQPTNAKKVNLTIISEAGVIGIDEPNSSTEYYFPYSNVDDAGVTFRPYFSSNDDYMVMSDDSDEETTIAYEPPTDTTINENQNSNDLNTIDTSKEYETIKHTKNEFKTDGSGHAPCLDYETQPVYFLTYKVRIHTHTSYAKRIDN